MRVNSAILSFKHLKMGERVLCEAQKELLCDTNFLYLVDNDI